MQEIARQGVDMKLTLIFLYVFIICATGQIAQTTISDFILFDDINSLFGWEDSELFNKDCRNTQQIAINSHSAIANGYLYDDCLFFTQPEAALLTYGHDGTEWLDYSDDKWTKLAGTGYHAIYARIEISAIDSGRDVELADSPACFELMERFIKEQPSLWNEDIGV